MRPATATAIPALAGAVPSRDLAPAHQALAAAQAAALQWVAAYIGGTLAEARARHPEWVAAATPVLGHPPAGWSPAEALAWASGH